MNPTTSHSKISSILITLAAAIILLAGMKAGASILGPLVCSVFLTLIFGMLLHWFERKGLSTHSAFILTLVIFFTIAAIFIVMIAGSFIQILSEIPRYQQELNSTLELVSPFLISVGIDPASLTNQNLIRSLSVVIGNSIGDIWNIASSLILIFATTIFLLFEAKGFSQKLQVIIGELRPGEVNRFIALAEKNVDYIVIRTEVNLAMGVGTAVILALLGVKYAALWGFLTFLLGFIPYIGFWLAVIPPMFLAGIDLGPVQALLVLVGSGLINVLAEYVMFPKMAAQGLELSTAVVFISLFVWGWILGGIGVLLAVPLTLLVQMVCKLFDETRWIGFMLGPSPDRNDKKE